MEEPLFLSLEHVLRLHARQLDQFGGAEGVRDLQLIESAIAQPRQGFGGEYVHKDIGEMAAAYLFHLAKNHGFIDGNKRVAAASALVFLEINGVDTAVINEDEMEALTLSIADGTGDKQKAAEFFRQFIS
jgi:death-on-curing protein